MQLEIIGEVEETTLGEILHEIPVGSQYDSHIDLHDFKGELPILVFRRRTGRIEAYKMEKIGKYHFGRWLLSYNPNKNQSCSNAK